ncbi:hypothetical protein K435DRAFT_673149 [Dendrothele bispora CBS 962.96]|uniref:Voltage-gated hydrogen channel 1 n=1 Tax=Dendrothele bispora (strain CBS 962.96) TaxID=1314807 RepID=A0A4S8LR28_DENBC|nr:hypothetical protein K435DRAFT_673149 [Dendrothele bispora CBS 962.96]
MPLDEQEPLLGAPDRNAEQSSSTRETLASFLESPTFHKFVIALIAIDAICVLADLSYSLLHPDCGCAPYPASNFASLSSPSAHRSPSYTYVYASDPEKALEILSHISLAITTLFLIEIPLHLIAFGFNYYNPLPGGPPHAGFHLFDLIVIVVTFVLEIVLRGGERELAGLLIVFRLWRLVKLVGGIAVGTSELSEEDTQELMKELEDTKRNLSEAAEENRRLRTRLAGLGQDDVLA